MKVKCINNDSNYLKEFEYESIEKEGVFGRFGTSMDTVFNEITIGRDYIVMGVIIFQNYQAYLIDDGGLISACPCQLFEVFG